MSTTETTQPIDRADDGREQGAGSERTARSAGPTLRAAPVPRRPAGVGLVGMILALALLALGALAVYDAIVLLGWADGEPPLTTALTGQAQIAPETSVAVIAGLAVLLGLLLLWTALKRGRSRGVRVDAATGVWLTWGDVEGLARATAMRHDGVLSARAHASRRRVDVSAETTSPDVGPGVEAAVRDRLAPLSPTPQISFRARPGRGGDR